MGRCSTATPSLWRSRSRRGTAPPRPRAMAGTGLAGTLTLVGALRPAAARRSVGALHAAALVRQRVCRRPARALTLGMPVGTLRLLQLAPAWSGGPMGTALQPRARAAVPRSPLAISWLPRQTLLQVEVARCVRHPTHTLSCCRRRREVARLVVRWLSGACRVFHTPCALLCSGRRGRPQSRGRSRSRSRSAGRRSRSRSYSSSRSRSRSRGRTRSRSRSRGRGRSRSRSRGRSNDRYRSRSRSRGR
jgi:hypothetical protein